MKNFLFHLCLLTLLIGSCQKAEETHEEERDKYEQMAAAMAQEFEMARDPQTGTVPKERLWEAYRYAQRLRPQDAARSGFADLSWQERGPDNFGGRTRALMVDPNDSTAKTLWAAGVSGGLWKTTDITATAPNWQPVNDFFTNLAVTCLAYDPANPQLMYFGTGEGYFNADAMRGLGIWKSSDGGNNWAPLSATQTPTFHYCYRLLHLGNDTLLAATRQGLCRSTDGGLSWSKVLGGGGVSNQIFDVQQAADGTLFAAADGSIHTSTDRGASFGPALNLPIQAGRIELACAPSDADYVYALVERNRKVEGILRSTDGGQNWSSMPEPADADFGIPATDFGRNQAWYNLCIAVDPNDRDRVFVGGIDLFVSANGGTSWQQVSHWWGGYGFQAVHADQHVITFQPGSSQVMYVGNDGGVYRSDNAQAAVPSLQSKSMGYRTLQFYACALHPDSGVAHFLAGSQDNGSHRFGQQGMNSTIEVTGGDGGFCHIDQDQPQYQLTSYVYNNYRRSSNGGLFFSYFNHSNTGRFINPFDYDDAANKLYAAYDSGYYLRWDDPQTGSSFTPVNAGFGGKVSAVRCDPNQAHRVYFGTGNGKLFRVDHAQGNTPNVTQLNQGAGMPGQYISCIEVAETNTDHLLVTYSNYGVVSVWESRDGGSNWQSVEGNLPDMPVRWAMFHPDDSLQALLGTELGVWTTDSLGGQATQWSPSSDGLAHTRVNMLKYRPSDRLLIAASYGRGLFSSDVFKLPQADFSSDRQVAYLGQPIRFEDHSVKAQDWSWDFGDGNVATARNPIHAYQQAGFFTVSLSINGGSEAQVKTQYIQVLPNRPTPYRATDGGDFESNPEDFGVETLSGTGFERGQSAQNGKQGTFSGSYAWVTGLTGNYLNDTETSLLSPNFDLSLPGIYTLRFRSRFSTEPNYDGFRVEYSLDQGSSWQALGTAVQAHWYNFPNSGNTGLFPRLEAYFSGNRSARFEEYYYDLTFLSGNSDVAFRFHFRSDRFLSAPGVAIDHFELDNYLLSAQVRELQGKWGGQAAELQWLGVTESDFQQFVVERGGERGNFRPIGAVSASTVSPGQESVFRFADPTIPPGPHVYRISWSDASGRQHVSNSILITRPQGGIALYPNPARETLFIRNERSSQARARLLQASGQVHKQFALPPGEHSLSLEAFSPGLYLLELSFPDGQRLVRKVVVRR